MVWFNHKKIVVFGYGAQGHAHALNLRDRGFDVRVALKPDSRRLGQAKEAGFAVLTDLDEAARQAEVAVILTPDEAQKQLYEKHLDRNLPKGALLLFAHGFAIHFSLFKPRADLDVVLVAPKGPGWALRKNFQAGSGLPCVLAVHQDASGQARDRALSYANAIGQTGIHETTFENEAITDLFGEQVVLCGGVPALMRAAYDTLTQAGYPPELAYFECIQELKLIADLIYERGIAGMYDFVSNTAEFGGLKTGEKIIDDHVRQKMREVLMQIKSGAFAREFVSDFESGGPQFKKLRACVGGHDSESVGQKIRGNSHVHRHHPKHW